MKGGYGLFSCFGEAGGHIVCVVSWDLEGGGDCEVD